MDAWMKSVKWVDLKSVQGDRARCVLLPRSRFPIILLILGNFLQKCFSKTLFASDWTKYFLIFQCDWLIRIGVWKWKCSFIRWDANNVVQKSNFPNKIPQIKGLMWTVTDEVACTGSCGLSHSPSCRIPTHFTHSPNCGPVGATVVSPAGLTTVRLRVETWELKIMFYSSLFIYSWLFLS